MAGMVVWNLDNLDKRVETCGLTAVNIELYFTAPSVPKCIFTIGSQLVKPLCLYII
jgi:hypothetical protein